MKDKGVKIRRAYSQGFRAGWHEAFAGRGSAAADRETSGSDASSPDTIPDGSVGVSASDPLTPALNEPERFVPWGRSWQYQESDNPGFSKDQQTLIDAAATIRKLTEKIVLVRELCSGWDARRNANAYIARIAAIVG